MPDRYVGGVEIEEHKRHHKWIAERIVIERFLVGLAGLNVGGLLYVLYRLSGMS